ncbi:MAG: hypothetical protein F6K53_26625 [Moorea sp. SIO4A1]|uniref:hypothetical protein n=1 Tax=Moorena sp. SIO4A1 TaxID=2607835 RepID=UPI00144F2878|nr:hypothetical protein [Moorena sp. SIO4A1]NEQ60798.1 hypothetical protein [Moorena sp. SIO4A1]
MAWKSVVEQASCLFRLPGIRGGTGILPVSTSGHQGWNRHLACFNFQAGRMPTLLLFSAKIQQCQKNAEVDSHNHFCLNPLKTID